MFNIDIVNNGFAWTDVVI